MQVCIRIKNQAGRIGGINVGDQIKNLLVVYHSVTHFEHFGNENGFQMQSPCEITPIGLTLSASSGIIPITSYEVDILIRSP